jgi:aspartyl/asparaginyl beta-hydroxylase (cupin superfamily)
MKSENPFTFRHLLNYDISNIKNIVKDFDNEWDLDISRQKTFDNHKATKTFFLLNYPLSWRKNSAYDGFVKYPESDLWQNVKSLVELLESAYDGKAGRVMLTKLMSNSNIDTHSDSGDYLDVVRRHHIPIITHDDVMFSVDGRSINMKEGEVWEINNMLPHSVENISSIDRVHLMIDIIPSRFLA